MCNKNNNKRCKNWHNCCNKENEVSDYPFAPGDKVRYLHNGEIYTFGDFFVDTDGQISSVCYTDKECPIQERFCAPSLLELVSKRERSLEERFTLCYLFGSFNNYPANFFWQTDTDEFSEFYDRDVIDLYDSRNLAPLIELVRGLDVEYCCDMIADEEPLTCRKVADWYCVWVEDEKQKLEKAVKARKLREELEQNDNFLAIAKVQLDNCKKLRAQILSQMKDLGYDENMNYVG